MRKILITMLFAAVLHAASAWDVLYFQSSPPYLGRLASNWRGSELYFATRMTLRGEPPQNIRKILRFDGTGVHTVLRDHGSAGEFPVQGKAIEYQSLQTDSSGFVSAWTATAPCSPGLFCPSGIVDSAFLRREPGAESQFLGFGRAAVSANGEWALASTDVPSLGAPESRRIRLSDGATEVVREYFRMDLSARRVMSDDGTVVNAFGFELLVWRPGSTRLEHVKMPRSLAYSAIDARGEVLVASSARPDHNLCVADLRTMDLRCLLESDEPVRMQSLSDDGSRALFLSASDWAGRNASRQVQAWLIDLTTGEIRQLTEEAHGVAEAVLSGDGMTAYVLSADQSILRIECESLRSSAVLPPFPMILGGDPDVTKWAPGGRYFLWGRGLGNVEIFLGDRLIEPAYQAPDDTELVLPGDLAEGQNLLRAGASDSPFQPYHLLVSVYRIAPAFLGSQGRGVASFRHLDGGAAVTEEDPGRAGEQLVARLTGLGPVDDEGNTLTPGIAWSVRSTGYRPGAEVMTPLEIISSKAVSGETGVYEVIVQLPESFPIGYMGIVCAGPPGTSWALFPLPIEKR